MKPLHTLLLFHCVFPLSCNIAFAGLFRKLITVFSPHCDVRGVLHAKLLSSELSTCFSFLYSSSTVTCCAAHVLSVCGSALHSADWKGRLDIASQLQAAMGSTESGIVMSGCAEALGMIAMGIVHDEFLLKR